MTDRTELRRLLDAATPRPWVAEASGETGPVVMDAQSISALDHMAKCPHYRGMADAQLIAAAVNALPDLLDQLDAAEDALNDAIAALGGDLQRAERDALTTVLPCDEKHEPPYDFAYCETHDRTFALGDHCDHAGLSAWDYLDGRERQQRGRAVRAEMSADEAEAERDALAAKLAEVRELAEHYAGLTNVDAGSAILRALDATPKGGES